MNKPITSSTYVRCLNHGMFRKHADYLDPQNDWKKVAADIIKPTGEPRYNLLHLSWEMVIIFNICERCISSQMMGNSWARCSITTSKCIVVLEGFRMTRLEKYDIVSISNSNQCFHNFTFHELMKLTSNSDERPMSSGGNKLGEGGFGVVYRGCFDNKVVAVKKLTTVSVWHVDKTGFKLHRDFAVHQQCQHENVVEMIGFSSDGDDGTSPLPWSTRCSIAVSTARGIEYLHNKNHIHRDIKSANVLLDKMLVPKIADFGLTPASEKLTSTVMTEKVVGMTAYMAPEALRGEVTPLSDVSSFGVVVLLEIISGFPPFDENREPQLLLDIKDEIEDEEMTVEDYVDKKMEEFDAISRENVCNRYSVS
ncbi:IRAK4 kinase, partial [Polyodon spathula]|nr:IRAK4 kinase [Polyodon spathula]